MRPSRASRRRRGRRKKSLKPQACGRIKASPSAMSPRWKNNIRIQDAGYRTQDRSRTSCIVHRASCILIGVSCLLTVGCLPSETDWTRLEPTIVAPDFVLPQTSAPKAAKYRQTGPYVDKSSRFAASIQRSAVRAHHRAVPGDLWQEFSSKVYAHLHGAF